MRFAMAMLATVVFLTYAKTDVALNTKASSVNSALLRRFLGDGTCHYGAQYQTIYEDIVGIDASTDYQDPFVEHILQVAAGQGLLSGRMLEIGPGPGHISHGLGRVFKKISLVEPNSHFFKSIASRLNSMDFEIHNCTFEDFECRKSKYDLVVISHVLYHVDSRKWGYFLAKAYDCVAEGGLLAIAMIHDDGPYYQWLTRHLGNAFSAREVRKLLDRLGLKYNSVIQPLSLVFNTGSVAQDFEAAYKLVYFLVVEDGIEQEQYRIMTVGQSKSLEKQLRDFTWSLFDPGIGSFTFTADQAYVFLPRASSLSGSMIDL